MRYTEYYSDYCPEFHKEKEIEIEVDEDYFPVLNQKDYKVMEYTCLDFGYCRTIDKLGDCPLYLKFLKNFKK